MTHKIFLSVINCITNDFNERFLPFEGLASILLIRQTSWERGLTILRIGSCQLSGIGDIELNIGLVFKN